MNIEITVPEVVDFFKQIQKQEKFFEMIRFNVQEEVGKYLSKLMGLELSHFLGRERYERKGPLRTIAMAATIGILPSKESEKCRSRFRGTGKASFGPRFCPGASSMKRR